MAAPVDNFNDNSLNTTVNWASTTATPIPYGATGSNFPAGGTVAEVNQRLELSPNAGWVGVSSLDTAIDASNTDKFFKLVDLDLANMLDGDRLLFGYQRTDASRYAFYELARAGGSVAGEWLYIGRSGYIGAPPPTFAYNPSLHVWFRQRQFSGSDIAWSVAPEGGNATTPGAWTEQRRLSTETSWAAHLAGGVATSFNPTLEGVWCRRAGGSGWTPRVDNYSFTDAGVLVRRPMILWFG